MKLVYPLGILAALSLAACSRSSDSAAPDAAPASSLTATPWPSRVYTGVRRNTPLDIIPVTIQPMLPKRGIFAAGGGTTTMPWRTIVDLDAGTVTTATSPNVGAAWFSKLEKESTRPVTGDERNDLTDLAEHAWREPMPTIGTPAAGYDEVLVSVDGAQAFFLEGYGPITPTAAARLVGKLKAFAHS
jgi:hypothetical protein